jgi:hypothetical protein
MTRIRRKSYLIVDVETSDLTTRFLFAATSGRDVIADCHTFFDARWARQIPVRFLRIRLHLAMAAKSP